MRIYFLSIISLFLFPLATLSQGDNGKNNMKLSQLTDNIYMLQARGGNIGLCVGEDGIFMVDDQFAESTPQILEELKNISEKSVQFLINTHHHGDHTGGNINMAQTGTTIFAHDNVRERLLAYIGKSSSEGKKVHESILPVVTFAEDLNFHYNNEKIVAFHVGNAHTDGDVMVYFTKNNVLHTGDAYFAHRYPYIDLKSGGTIEGYISGLQKAYELINEDTKIIPGHGPVAKKQDLFYTINMLNRIYKQVTLYHSEGKSIEEILTITEITSSYDDRGFGDGFITREKMLRTVYDDVVKEKSEKK